MEQNQLIICQAAVNSIVNNLFDQFLLPNFYLLKSFDFFSPLQLHSNSVFVCLHLFFCSGRFFLYLPLYLDISTDIYSHRDDLEKTY